MLAFTAEDHWEPGIGDPSLMGWITVAAYFAAALLCWKSARRERQAPGAGTTGLQASFFWLALSCFLLLLGVNKQLDLQTWFTLFAKRLALDEGWYEQRHLVQMVFILGIGGAGIIGVAVLCWLTRSSLRRHALALAGSLFLACFILIRASSFHHVDTLLGMRLAGFKMNWILELSGIFLVGFSSVRSLRAHDRPHPMKLDRLPTKSCPN